MTQLGFVLRQLIECQANIERLDRRVQDLEGEVYDNQEEEQECTTSIDDIVNKVMSSLETPQECECPYLKTETPKWIDIKQQQPSWNEKYIGLDATDNTIDIHEGYKDYVTHWLPMPKVPE